MKNVECVQEPEVNAVQSWRIQVERLPFLGYFVLFVFCHAHFHRRLKQVRLVSQARVMITLLSSSCFRVGASGYL